jgi:lysine biosynthesis protein LysW
MAMCGRETDLLGQRGKREPDRLRKRRRIQMADVAKKRRGAGSAPHGGARDAAAAMPQKGRNGGSAEKQRAKEGTGGKILCPVCDAGLDLDKDELGLFNRLRCEECEALLEVVDEDPIRLEWIEEDDDFEDDEELDAEEEDEDDDYF